ncbi:MAG: hypothetical protein KKB90_05585 [Actinobacteria bacterium]|nr:hypothetical protein [Actinomycetota bacterium]MCG2818177.1 hypothetical protein [Actinomycetes bacterium]MBU4218419.1 hypothetical protein [Actinomycetota bacterium]MBU4358490.1 hypothetical protein [Actinomycetota bacterium]MBU4393077.1 hypothetical protein [Actinomycetota bacterium]
MAVSKQKSMRRKQMVVAILALFIALTFVLTMIPINCSRDSEEVTPEEVAGEVVEQPIPPETPPETTGIDAAIGAAVAYAKANNPSLPELAILGVNSTGEWALVRLQPVDKSTDVASALLKNVNGEWAVVDFGLVLPENHPDAPPDVFQ